MIRYITTAAVSLALTGSISSSLNASNRLQTNFIIQASSNTGIEKGAPCYIVYENETTLQTFVDSGVDEQVRRTLAKKGYLMVNDANSAVVFVKIDYLQGEPYETDVSIEQQPHLDYSNTTAATNLAAKVSGRYSELNESSRQPTEYAGETILGPDGKPIDTSKKRETGAEVVKEPTRKSRMIVYPLMLQLIAWRFENVEGAPQALNQWSVVAKHGNIAAEELSPQLNDMARTAVKFIGKNLKEPRTVSRNH